MRLVQAPAGGAQDAFPRISRLPNLGSPLISPRDPSCGTTVSPQPVGPLLGADRAGQRQTDQPCQRQGLPDRVFARPRRTLPQGLLSVADTRIVTGPQEARASGKGGSQVKHVVPKANCPRPGANQSRAQRGCPIEGRGRFGTLRGCASKLICRALRVKVLDPRTLGRPGVANFERRVVNPLADLDVGRLSSLSMVVLEHLRAGSSKWLLVGRPRAISLDDMRTSVLGARLIARRTTNKTPPRFLRFPERIFFPRRTA